MGTTKNARQEKSKAQSLRDTLTAACRAFDIATASETLKRIKLKNYEWGHYVTTIYDDSSLSWSQQEQLLALFVKYRSASNSSDEEAVVANLWYTLSNYSSTTIKDDEDESMEREEPDQEELRSETSGDGDAASEERPQMSWQEYIGRQLCETYPYLASQKGTSREGQTVLELAIGHEAYWVIPVVQKNDDYFIRAATKELEEALRKGEKPSTVLSLAVQIGNVDTIQRLVALYKYFDIEPAEDEFILQNAILQKNAFIVDILLNAFESLVMQRRNGKSALQELRGLGIFEDKTKMEQSLVSKIVRLRDIALSRQLLYDSSSLPMELCLDLAFFNDTAYDFERFLHYLDTLTIDFESTLSYVQLPELANRFDSLATTDRQEAFQVLCWLSRSGVNTIIDLQVPDALYGGHSEEIVEKCLDVFDQIELLDWRKLDMSLETVNAAQGVHTLWLYSSGNWGVLAQWTGMEGLVTYPNIKEVHIIFVKDVVSDQRIEKYKKRITDRLQEMQQKRQFKFHIEAKSWSRLPAGSSSKQHRRHAYTIGPKKLLKIEEFLDAYRTLKVQDPNPTHSLGTWKPVKVAIIDTGVDLSASGLALSVEKGKSFVHTESDRGSRESPWFLSSEPHGTQMASLIRDLDDRCRLYIAKVGTDRESNIKALQIQEAIEWAISEGVDIISMSMILRDRYDGIYTALRAAHEAGIAFICSTEDHGSQNPLAYPAAHAEETISISACDNLGNLLHSADTRAKYYFQGENVHVASLSYSDAPKDEISGSSVATALAAGTASLALSCRNFASPNSTLANWTTVTRVFDDMRQDNGEKYIRPWTVFGEVKGEGEIRWTLSQWREWLEHKFGKLSKYASL